MSSHRYHPSRSTWTSILLLLLSCHVLAGQTIQLTRREHRARAIANGQNEKDSGVTSGNVIVTSTTGAVRSQARAWEGSDFLAVQYSYTVSPASVSCFSRRNERYLGGDFLAEWDAQFYCKRPTGAFTQDMVLTIGPYNRLTCTWEGNGWRIRGVLTNSTGSGIKNVNTKVYGSTLNKKFRMNRIIRNGQIYNPKASINDNSQWRSQGILNGTGSSHGWAKIKRLP